MIMPVEVSSTTLNVLSVSSYLPEWILPRSARTTANTRDKPYGLCNKISIYRLEVDADKCVNCGKCKRECGMEVDPVPTGQAKEAAGQE